MNKHSAVNVLFIVALMCLFFLHIRYDTGLGWFALLLLLYLSISSLGSYFIQLNYFVYSYCKGSTTKPQIAITFDDGPNEHTERMLDILKKENAPATFFCIGKNIAGNEAILKRIDAEGHLIGNHSFYHKVSFPMQSGKAIANEIAECSDVINSVIGKRPKLFRPPFGVTDPMVASGIRLAEVHSIGWSVRSYDTVMSDPDQLLNRIKHVTNGDIVLLHEAGIHTEAILSQFIKNVRAKGLEIIPLDRLSGIYPYEK